MEMKLDNFTIRLLCMDDLAAYYHLIDTNRKRLEDFFAGTVAITHTIEDTERHLADVVQKAEKKNYFPFIVVDDASGKLIASIQIKSIDWSVPKAELGYYVDAAYEGKGLITKAIDKIIPFAFEQLQFAKLYIRTHQSNAGSRIVAEKNGFTLEGVLKAEYKTTAGRLIDVMYYGLLNPAIPYEEVPI